MSGRKVTHKKARRRGREDKLGLSEENQNMAAELVQVKAVIDDLWKNQKIPSENCMRKWTD